MPQGDTAMDNINTLFNTLSEGTLPGALAGCRVYPRSLHAEESALFFMAHTKQGRYLFAAGDKVLPLFEGETISILDIPAKKCPLTPGNAKALMELFPFTAPVSHRNVSFTMGLGDRLGLASPGHISAICSRNVFPVLAQQSIRELKLTGRTYEEVLAAAAFAVFQEDWRGGYGADGDHLKTAEEILYALNCGFSMITLDCSEKIDKNVHNLGKDEINAAYEALPATLRAHYEEKYAEKLFRVGAAKLTIGTEDLKAIVLTYHQAVVYTAELYNLIIKNHGRTIDFEMSIDETLCATTPQAHFVVAKELIDGGVRIVSLAPRFCGEFQKGIDYIGSPEEFEKDFILHQQIADHFRYKLSIHSGSDKIAVFAIIGRHTGLRVHVKTAGTNWLEALRVIAAEDPALFRELLAFAIEHLDEARAYYHIGAKPSGVAPLESIPDGRLTTYLDNTDARQILHITYGLILQAKNTDGSPRFKQRIYSLLHRCEDSYAKALEKHIGRHIDTLCCDVAGPVQHG
jgi:tagaturonate epimerase